MTSLFDSENPASGFRLSYLEIFNWGTFDSKIWQIKPDGKSSLLTGGNGSGKTTLADALVTLLVPPAKRYYNQSSGAERKKERNEKTYVQGAYKTLKGETELSAKTQYLRTKDDFSILLAVFYNKDADEFLSLSQVRWYANNDLKKSFILSPVALGIKEHFYPMDTGGKWKKRLKNDSRAEFYESFAQYSRRFIKGFGLRSDKALSLFSQTVGIKDIENLNRFIRTHMLEETNVEEHFRKLRENYDNLLLSHRAIEKAKKQMDLLEPVEIKGNDFRKAEENVKNLDRIKEFLPLFFAQKEMALLTKAVQQGTKELEQTQDQTNILDQQLVSLEDDRDALVTAIGNNEAAGELRLIETKVNLLEAERENRRNYADTYSRAARQLGLPHAPDQNIFLETVDEIKKRSEKNEDRKNILTKKNEETFAELSQMKTLFDEKIEEVTFIRKRRSNIPAVYQKIRDRIAEHLGIDPEDIPFAGELIAVKPSEKQWEKGMESVLRNLGLSLLVKQKHCDELNTYLDTTLLHGRIVYLKVDGKNAPGLFDTIHPESITKKITLKPETQFSQWLDNYLSRNFQFILTDHLKTFNRHNKSCTQSGLTKDVICFEKDDRPEYLDQGGCILGWDNKEKILHIEKQARLLENRIKALEQEISVNKKQLTSLEKEKEDLIKLAGFTRFQDINLKPVIIEIEELKTRREKLLADSDKLRALEKQLADVKNNIAKNRGEKEKRIATSSLINEKLRQYKEKIKTNRSLLDHDREVSLEEMMTGLTYYIDKSEPILLDNLDRLKEQVISRVDKDYRLGAAKKGAFETGLVRSMQEFRNPEEEVREQFPDWMVETINLKSDAAYLKEYLSIYNRIKKEDLPAYKKRFKKYLNEQVIFDIANFKTTLENQVEEIKKSIRQINRSLIEINYSNHPPTYIELIEQRENDTRITQFIEMLKAAIPDAAKVQQGDEQELEFAFNRIKAVIDLLSQDPDKRRYITDVRNWLKFSAVEKYKEDGAQAHYYEDSQSLSGGEKAKLAYTILASALAYQFGISRRRFNIRSLRFVVVDEAFSKVDPENSVYAMELFSRLNLQVMLITPLDKINLAERFIHSVHYVENKNQRDSSVFDLTMEEYYREKKSR